MINLYLFFLPDYSIFCAVTQGIYSRTERFDTMYSILSVTDFQSNVKPPSVWLNVQVKLTLLAILPLSATVATSFVESVKI